MARYFLFGGPCDGRSSPDYATRPAIGFSIICESRTYRFDFDGSFHVVGGVALPPPPGGGPNTQQVGSAWHALMRAMGVRMPGAINRSRHGRRRIRRAVR